MTAPIRPETLVRRWLIVTVLRRLGLEADTFGSSTGTLTGFGDA